MIFATPSQYQVSSLQSTINYLSAVASREGGSTLRNLLVHDLDCLIEHFASEPMDPFDADVLIQLRPMNSQSLSDTLMVISFGDRYHVESVTYASANCLAVGHRGKGG
jgi:hypothetical protein